MSGDAPKDQDVGLKEFGSHGVKSSYGHLQTAHTELDLVKCSEDIENDVLEASLEEYQCVAAQSIEAGRMLTRLKALLGSTRCRTVTPRLSTG
jgi:hypothetical protein